MKLACVTVILASALVSASAAPFSFSFAEEPPAACDDSENAFFNCLVAKNEAVTGGTCIAQCLATTKVPEGDCSALCSGVKECGEGCKSECVGSMTQLTNCILEQEPDAKGCRCSSNEEAMEGVAAAVSFARSFAQALSEKSNLRA
eukprot:CAMPEP_0172539426 /NCGR_PEP_ID=MMETSP1067-20121228/10621_1 /TAXON_ID=265564 ORGANISM="Thalassiosira punctigera, Strain Tpunct2005C2" /NCGR_SAMPLE_ID=MMETSP1067 /ASSEMBLY_ACC=CAM_ASM_000444 /LENGTH=145 /DNA_ID=CAMNT_0013325107 /DNA_START=71 /DNA_END=508 /DNA_ORIENTATION=-